MVAHPATPVGEQTRRRAAIQCRFAKVADTHVKSFVETDMNKRGIGMQRQDFIQKIGSQSPGLRLGRAGGRGITGFLLEMLILGAVQYVLPVRQCLHERNHRDAIDGRRIDPFPDIRLAQGSVNRKLGMALELDVVFVLDEDRIDLELGELR